MTATARRVPSNKANTLQIFQEQIAIANGGASGIGQALAVGFAKEGARVCIGDILQAQCDDAAAAIGQGAASTSWMSVIRVRSIYWLNKYIASGAD